MAELPLITSSQNPLFRHCLRLRDNRKRRRSGQFLIDGTVEIQRAFQAKFQIDTLMMCPRLPLAKPLSEIVETHPNITLQPIAQPLMDRLSYGQNSLQPIAIAREPNLSLELLDLDDRSLVLILDRVEKPGNLGAVVRSAVACGATALILTRPICDPFNPNAIRASRGAIFQLPVAETTPELASQRLQSIGLTTFAACVEGGCGLWQLPLSGGAALVFGNEKQGLDEQWLRDEVARFTIPMQNEIDSLNLSISAAVTLYEAVRQRSNP